MRAVPLAAPSVRLHLVDLDREVTRALRASFAPFPEVSVATGNVLAVAHHVLVSPANSSGFMDGGVDAAYAAHFGPQLARRVRDAVRARPEGIVPVGSSLVVETGHGTVPFLVVAPTMLAPEHVPAANAYRALRAALRLADAPTLHGDWYCPGLTTGVGAVDPQDAAHEMAAAYADWRAAQTAP